LKRNALVARFAVPDKIFGLTLILDFIDRCTSKTSLYLPQAALGLFAQSKRSTANKVGIKRL